MANENLKKAVGLGAEALNVGSQVMNGGGLLSLLQIIDEVNEVKNMDKAALLVEIKALDPAGRKDVEDYFKAKLSLVKKDVEMKIEAGADLLEEAVGLAYQGVELVEKGLALVTKVKLLIS